ncbi:MAG: NADH-quinone oxidoreductase subunit NuoE [Alphaproteobacteria bacterium]|nr:MAG: NADH-quinone oxidoreductase subunit NuoE [Alphaproteobacteria bacterium]|tara:strand:- start:230 stop:823 length:594 start_codon:yes stop_codon:yes gene_type:complete
MKKEQLKAENYKLCNIDQVKVDEILDKYPTTRKASAVIPLLHYVQKKSNGWLPVPEIERVAEILDMPYMKVYEVASFYTMFNLKPVGKKLLQLCHTTPCWLRGSDQIEKSIYDTLKIKDGETTPDDMFTLMKVECLGACVNAPILQINDDYYEDLDYKSTKELLNKIKTKKNIKPGSVIGRKSSEPYDKNGNVNVTK